MWQKTEAQETSLARVHRKGNFHKGKEYGLIPTGWLSSVLTHNALRLLTLTEF